MPSAIAVRAEPFNGSGTAADDFENQLARIVGDELRKAVMPLLAEIDAIAALVKECVAELSAVSKDFITRASGKLGGRNTPPAPRRMFVKPCFYFALVPLFQKTRRFDAARFDGRGVFAVLR